MAFLNEDEQRTIEQLSRMPNLTMKTESKQRIRQNLVDLSVSQRLPRRRLRARFNGLAAGVAGVAIVVLGYFAFTNHGNPVTNHHITASNTIPQAETSQQQSVVNQMTAAQQLKLHQLLTRDTQIADLGIYNGDTDPTLVTQMESDFKEFQSLFPQQIESIKAEPDSFYENTLPDALSPGVDGNVLTGDLSAIYLAYEAAIWNMGDPNSILLNHKLTQLVQRPDVPGIFSEWNRVFFGGRIASKSLTQ